MNENYSGSHSNLTYLKYSKLMLISYSCVLSHIIIKIQKFLWNNININYYIDKS